MRPIELRLQAFGPFVTPQQLDFRQLGEHRLFLISGPTGAGKTTLLDAIAFALYGTSSGDERAAEQLRSQQADAHTLTEVRFDFAIGRRRYRVHRVPRQTRAKLRGEGTTLESAAATLWERTDSADDADEGRVLASGFGKVTEHIEALIGFRGEQFRQVMLLPQGRFRELLTADAREREQILETLFRTEHYSRIQQALKAHAEQIRKAAERLGVERDTQLANSGCADETELDARIAALNVDVHRLDAQVQAHKHAEQTTRNALESGRNADQRLRALARARAQLDALTRQAPAIEALNKELDAARRADALRDLHARVAQRRAEHLQAEAKHQQAETDAKTALAAQQRAEASLARETARAPERDALRARIHQLDALRARVAALEEARQALSETEQAANATEREHRNATDAAENTRQALRDATARREQLAYPAARRELLDTQLSQLSRQTDQRRRLDLAAADRGTLQNELQAAEQAETAARAELARAREAQERLLRRWQDGQAQHLAAGLSPGAPCPVCGATDHPSPAAGDTEVPDQAALNTAKQGAMAAERRLEEGMHVLADLRRRLAKQDSALAALQEGLGDWAQRAHTDMEAALKQLRMELTQAQDAAREIERIDGQRGELEAGLIQLQQTAEAAGTRHQQAAQDLAAARRVLEERSSDIPEALRDPEALQAQLTQQQRGLAAAEQALEQARADAQQRARALAAAETARETLSQQGQAAAEALAAATEDWQGRRIDAGFESDAKFASAHRTPDQQTTAEQRINAHRDALVGARATLANAETAASGLTPPDLAALEQAAQAATHAREQAQQQAGELAAESKRLSTLAGELAKLRQRLADHHARYAVAGRVAEVANSKNPHRLSFQRFVLGALLDDVLRAASERLLAMSRGRYRLLRSTETGDRRGLGGLDLIVEDGYTGMTRTVATLSGGEGFQAALSLALALAETVQAYAGGLHLDAIFIDEGFGSLDPEALELAVDTLMDLQQTGRLVGVISHVPELKERLDVRLEVSAARGGSAARFVLP